MPGILGIFALFILSTDVWQWDLSLSAGLSAKNLLLYFIACLLILRMVIARASITAAAPMQAAWLTQLFYAVFTWLIASLVIKYQGYDMVASGMKLKTHLLDYIMFFLVYLFGIRTADEALKVCRWILLGVLFANLMTVLDAAGLVHLGFRIREDGRTQGALGESNQYAAVIVLMLPAIIASAVASRGAQRLFWLGGAFISAVALVMTASRGAFVGVIVALGVGAYLYRHLVQYSRVVGWVLGPLLALIVVLSLSQYGGLLTDRVFGQTSSIDANTASSGRSDIWLNALTTMFESPVTFLTGYGWDVYWSMPFGFSPHNHYLALWFNLGLVGLISGSYLLFSAIGRARRASFRAAPPYRGQLIAFVIGGTGLCTAIFFVDLHTPWIYFWTYAGVVVRLALCVEEMPVAAAVALRTPIRRATKVARDPFGWTANSGRSTQ